MTLTDTTDKRAIGHVRLSVRWSLTLNLNRNFCFLFIFMLFSLFSGLLCRNTLISRLCCYCNVWFTIFIVDESDDDSGADYIGAPISKNVCARGAPWVEKQQTKKLTKLQWSSRKRSLKRLEPKKWRGTKKNFKLFRRHWKMMISAFIWSTN